MRTATTVNIYGVSDGSVCDNLKLMNYQGFGFVISEIIEISFKAIIKFGNK